MASSVDLADQWLRIAGTWLAMEKFQKRRSAHAAELAILCVPDSRNRTQN